MEIEPVPFVAVDWDQHPVVEVLGETGKASVREVQAGNLRLRMVEYSRGYRADHWCDRGHAVHVLEGACVVEIQDGRAYPLVAGMSFYVGDGLDLHRLFTEAGCEMPIVD